MKKKEVGLLGVEAETSQSRMRIDPQGARIKELMLLGLPVLITVARGDGKEASTHPCTPIFGEDGAQLYGLQRHGNMRNTLCEVFRQSSTEAMLGHEITDRSYPRGVTVYQTFSLKDGMFALVTIHVNEGEKGAPVNFGEHFYFNASHGWQGLSINGVGVSNFVETDGVIPLLEQNRIRIPGIKEIVMHQRGFRFANLWVYKDPETQAYDSHYVCIEPVEFHPIGGFGSPDSILKPDTHRVTQVGLIFA